MNSQANPSGNPKRSAVIALAVLGALALLMIVTSAKAEVLKIMNISNGQMQPVFRLNFTPPKGWIEDKDATKKFGLPMYVAAGKTFDNAPTVTYIRVSYNPEHKQSLESFIDTAHERWMKSATDSKIDKIASQPRADGRSDFQIYSFKNPSSPQQAFELMAYGEDEDKDGNWFFLMIALSAKSQKAIDGAEALYRQALKAH